MGVASGDECIGGFVRGSDFEGTDTDAGVLRHQGDGMIEIACFKKENTAKHFFGLCIGSVGDGDGTIPHAECYRVLGGLEGFPLEEVSAAVEFVIIGETLFHQSLTFFGRKGLILGFIDESHANELHWVLPVGGGWMRVEWRIACGRLWTIRFAKLRAVRMYAIRWMEAHCPE